MWSLLNPLLPSAQNENRTKNHWPAKFSYPFLFVLVFNFPFLFFVFIFIFIFYFLLTKIIIRVSWTRFFCAGRKLHKKSPTRYIFLSFVSFLFLIFLFLFFVFCFFIIFIFIIILLTKIIFRVFWTHFFCAGRKPHKKSPTR